MDIVLYFSYGCWFYWTNTNTLSTLMGKRDGANTINVPGGSNYNQWGLTISDSMCCGPAGKNIGNCIISDGWSKGGCSLSAPLPNYSGWVYGFITVDTNVQKVFINGKVAGTNSDDLNGGTFNIVGRSVYVGCTGGETEGTIIGQFNNKIRLAHVYNRTLSESEVLQNYLATMNPSFIFGSSLNRLSQSRQTTVKEPLTCLSDISRVSCFSSFTTENLALITSQ